jgi:hypothetical protein
LVQNNTVLVRFFRANEEIDQALSGVVWQFVEGGDRAVRFRLRAGMELNCLNEIGGPAIVRKVNPLTQAPKRRGTPFIPWALP